MDNPLLARQGLPAFRKIRADHVQPAIDNLLEQNRAELQRLLEQTEGFTWNNLVLPLEAMDDRLSRAWSPVRHLNGVMNSTALREAYNACLPKISAYYTELAQNQRLYRAYQAIVDSGEYARLDAVQQKVIDDALRDFRLGGVALPEDKKRRFKVNAERLAELKSRFENNLLDATDAWSKQVREEQALAGLPPSVMGMARQAAQAKGLDGWLLTLQAPSYIGVMTYADDRQLRREVYQAYCTRASDQGPHGGRWDNRPVMDEILALRQEQAELLGFSDYAERSLTTKMAGSADEVVAFLDQLAARAKPLAEKEFAELQAFAREVHGLEELQAWDVAYYAEKLKQQRYALSQEELKPYFPAEKVIEGLFAIVQRLFGLRIAAREGVETWHDDVRFYEIHDAEDQYRGAFYLDLYARDNKRGGAWMDDCITRRRTAEGIQYPVAYLTCNASPPLADRPALLTHDEVTTLFHEFGHGLHHMLTQIDYAPVAGISGVEWDAVELPSQLMENWCWERRALKLISTHHETGEPLPDALFDKLEAARNFQAAMMMMRQLEFSLFDMKLHRHYRPGLDIQQVLDEVRAEVAVVTPPAFNRFQNSFSHIFAGGYAAGYYSYKWAEVLSADAFARFEETDIFDPEVGLQFMQCVLERGGSRPAMELFMEFRGREPSIDALLRHNGLDIDNPK